jgi:hypothetical protein
MLTPARKSSIGCGRLILEARAQATRLAACVPSLSLSLREQGGGSEEREAENRSSQGRETGEVVLVSYSIKHSSTSLLLVERLSVLFHDDVMIDDDENDDDGKSLDWMDAGFCMLMLG